MFVTMTSLFMSLQLKLVFKCNIYLRMHVSKSYVMLLVGMFGVSTKKVWLNKQAMAVFFQEYKSRLITNRRYDDIIGKFFTPEDHTIGRCVFEIWQCIGRKTFKWHAESEREIT